MRAPALVSLLAACAGCATLPTLQSPRTIQARTLRAGVEGSYLTTAGGASREADPTVAVTARYGLTDAVEVGLRAGFVRPELFATFRLGAPGPDEVAWAISPMFCVVRASDSSIVSTYAYGSLALLAGIPLWGRTELVIAPKLDVGFAAIVGRPAAGFSLTPLLSVGWEVRLWDWLRVMPAVAVGYALVNASPGQTRLGGGVAVQGALAVLFGDGVRDGGPDAK